MDTSALASSTLAGVVDVAAGALGFAGALSDAGGAAGLSAPANGNPPSDSDIVAACWAVGLVGGRPVLAYCYCLLDG